MSVPDETKQILVTMQKYFQVVVNLQTNPTKY